MRRDRGKNAIRHVFTVQSAQFSNYDNTKKKSLLTELIHVQMEHTSQVSGLYTDGCGVQCADRQKKNVFWYFFSAKRSIFEKKIKCNGMNAHTHGTYMPTSSRGFYTERIGVQLANRWTHGCIDRKVKTEALSS